MIELRVIVVVVIVVVIVIVIVVVVVIVIVEVYLLHSFPLFLFIQNLSLFLSFFPSHKFSQHSYTIH